MKISDPWFKGLQWALLRCQSPPLNINKIDPLDLKSLFKFEHGPVPPHLKWFNADEDPATIGIDSPPSSDIPPVPDAKLSVTETLDIPVSTAKEATTVPPAVAPALDQAMWADFDFIRVASYSCLV